MDLQKIKKLLTSKASDVFNKLDMKCEKFGDNIYSICPVHESSDNPRAFSFSEKRGIWKCWTRDCQQEFRNDIFGLIAGALSNRSGKRAEFKDVLSWINKEFKLNINDQIDQEQKEETTDFDNLISIINSTVNIPQHKYIDLNLSIKTPSEYFISRGFKPDTLNYFGVGDCIDKGSKLYNRALIPIHDDHGQGVVGYTCRSIKEYKTPKFLIYPNGFDKRCYLYNMHRAIQCIKQTNSVFIVEGQGDVWRLFEAGINNVIGMFGKTLSKEQEFKLQQLPITSIIVLTDNDQAGRESKIQLQRQLGRFYKLTFPRLHHKDIGDMSIEQIKETVISQIKGIA